MVEQTDIVHFMAWIEGARVAMGEPRGGSEPNAFGFWSALTLGLLDASQKHESHRVAALRAGGDPVLCVPSHATSPRERGTQGSGVRRQQGASGVLGNNREEVLQPGHCHRTSARSHHKERGPQAPHGATNRETQPRKLGGKRMGCSGLIQKPGGPTT